MRIAIAAYGMLVGVGSVFMLVAGSFAFLVSGAWFNFVILTIFAIVGFWLTISIIHDRKSAIYLAGFLLVCSITFVVVALHYSDGRMSIPTAASRALVFIGMPAVALFYLWRHKKLTTDRIEASE